MVLRKRAHDTEAARRVAGVDTTIWWEFQPGQRVLTTEGLPGTVDSVDDGPHPGSEQYIVTLDNGMGGGEYGPGELRPLNERAAVWVDTPESDAYSQAAAEMVSRSNDAKIWVDGVTEAAVDGSKHTADQDYPELGNILVERPPLAHATTAAKKQAAKVSVLSYGLLWDPSLTYVRAMEEQVDWDTLPVTSISPDEPLYASEPYLNSEPIARVVSGQEPFRQGYIAHVAIDGQGRKIMVDGNHRAAMYRALHQAMPSKVYDMRLTHYASAPGETDGEWTCDVCAKPAVVSVGGVDLCGDDANALGATTGDKKISGKPDAAQKCKWCDNQAVGSFLWAEGMAYIPFCESHREQARTKIEVDNNDEVIKEIEVTGGILDRILDPWARGTIERLPPEYRPGAQGPGSRWSFDWCRFRKNRRCMYAKELNIEATFEAGYAVWHPVDRGLCPRDKWDQQKTCPVAEPGPHSGEPNARIDATVPWEQGGQRGGIPERRSSLESLAAYYWPGSNKKITPQEIADLMVERGEITPEQLSKAKADGKVWQQVVYQQGGRFMHRLWTQREVDMRTNEMFEPTIHPKPTEEDWDEIFEWVGRPRTKAATTKLAFEFFAAWQDVQAKAKRLRSEGGVRILSVSDRYVAGQVKGDRGEVYNTSLEYAPGLSGRAIAMWDCTCPWSTYAWGRAPEYKRLEGRQCAHALALSWEAQSRGMFGKEIEEDTEALASKTARELPRMVRNPNSVEEVVDWMMKVTQRVEPNITRDMKNIVNRASRPTGPAAWVTGRLEGLRWKFKERDSLLRKFRGKVATDPNGLKDPFLVVKDALRYTMVFPDIEWARDVQRATYALIEKGYKITESENSWARGDAYSGLHYTLEDPSHTLQIELQFHTDASYDLKQNKMHLLYEEYRDPKTPLARKREIWKTFTQMYERLPMPEHALEYEELRFYAPPGVSDKNWKPPGFGRAAQVHPDLAEAPAVMFARALLSEGVPFPQVAEHMASLGAENGLAIVTEAMAAKPITVQVPGKGKVQVVEIEPSRGVAILDDGTEVPGNRVLYPDFHPTRGLSLTGLRLAQTDSTGVMVALRPPEAVCEALEFEGGEPVEEMHITLCYLGKTDEVDRDALEAAVRTWAQTAGSLVGRIAGFGQFLNGGEEPAVLIALWDIPGLDRFRLALKDTLAANGVARAENHGFTPHLTLAYGEEPFEDVPEVPEEAAGAIPFETVIVAYGGEWREYPLQGPAPIMHPVQVAADLKPFPDQEGQMWYDGGHVQWTRAGSGEVIDVRRALIRMTAKCPKCGKLAGFEAACQNCGFIGPKLAAVEDDAVQMLTEGYERGEVSADAVTWFAPNEAGQAIAEDRLGDKIDPTIATAQVTAATIVTDEEGVAHVLMPNGERYPYDQEHYDKSRWGRDDAWGLVVGEKHEPDEAALPETTSEDDDEDNGADAPKPGDQRLSWLMSGTQRTSAAQAAENLDIAGAAREALAKMGLKTFTPAEQKSIIDEGEDVTAGNLAALDITGTHYEALESALQDEEEEGVGLWL